MRAIVLASTALVLASAALAYDPVADTRKIMAGTVTTAKIKNEYLSGARDGTAVFKGALAAYKAVRAAEAPAPVPAPVVSLTGLPPIASNFDVNLAINAAGGIPGTGAPDIVGAFRFICGAGQLSYDDPILFPGQPGKSHLHQFYGNIAADAHSTYASLRAAGDSTCNWTGQGVAANRSAYWMPAMLDGKGNVVRPDFVSIYYKQRPQTDPTVSDPTNARYLGKAVQLPNGIKFIFGWDPTGANVARSSSAWFSCQGPNPMGPIAWHEPDLRKVLAACPAGNQFGAVIEAPDCWDGKNLDSSDHRSHVSYSTYGDWGYLKCPATHPYNIPTFQMGAWYTVGAGDTAWELSSDHMAPDKPKGHTFHADFFMAWDQGVHDTWYANCIQKLLSCSGGQLGNGKDLKGAQQPNYGWKHPQRLVPVPGA